MHFMGVDLACCFFSANLAMKQGFRVKQGKGSVKAMNTFFGGGGMVLQNSGYGRHIASTPVPLACHFSVHSFVVGGAGIVFSLTSMFNSAPAQMLSTKISAFSATSLAAIRPGS